jgi:hypothetical protein
MLVQANAQLSWLPTHMSAADDLDHSAPTAYPLTCCSHVVINIVHSVTGRCPVLWTQCHLQVTIVTLAPRRPLQAAGPSWMVPSEERGRNNPERARRQPAPMPEINR